MSSHFGIDALHRVAIGWANAMRHLHECPPVPGLDMSATIAKAYESGVIVHTDPRFVDVTTSPVCLPAGFWRRAIISEHAA
jgi:hypothetical protein